MVSTDPKAIVEAVRRAGVVGAGGGGFPTHVKLSAKVDIVIANGSECEPLLATDKTMMKLDPELLMDGLSYVMKATGAKKGYVAVKGHYKDVVEALKKALPKDGQIELFLMENYYPAGDEFLMVYDVTGRVIPEGGIPLEVGVVVSNVITMMQVARAVHGVPVTMRTLSIVGEVKNPCVVNAPVGMSYAELINIAKGFTVADPAVIDGGPMMGKIVSDLNSGIAKTTSGILVLPRDHLIVRMKERTIDEEAKLSKAACCQCFRCTDLCPRNLLGHELYPHMTMRTIAYMTPEPTAHVTSAFLCSQCGVCELIACDIMRLSPKRVFADLRKRLVAAGVKTPHRRKGFDATENINLRKLPIPSVMKKLGIESYYNSKIEMKGDVQTANVKIWLNRHTGAPAEPFVRTGDIVKRGDLIGEIPENKLGARYHASISGKVTDVTGNCVEIVA